MTAQSIPIGREPKRGSFRIALIQMAVEGGEKERNLRRAEARIAEAAAQGADLALLPEAMDLGWTHPSCRTQAGAIPGGGAYEALSDSACRHGIYVCSGLVERASGGVFNSAVILDRQGNLALLHRKLNELTIGHEYYAQGDRLQVCHTELGTLGLMICADGFAENQALTHALGYMGSEVILSPCAWAVSADHDNEATPYGQLWRRSYTSVARAFSMWIIGVSNVGWLAAGPWEGRKCIGCSLVVDPEGNAIMQGPYGVEAETILYADITPVPRPARGCGWVEHWEAARRGATKPLGREGQS